MKWRHFQIGEVIFNLAFKWGMWWLKQKSTTFSLSSVFPTIRRIQTLQWGGIQLCAWDRLVFSCIQTIFQRISNVKHLSRGLEDTAVCCSITCSILPFPLWQNGPDGNFPWAIHDNLKMSPCGRMCRMMSNPWRMDPTQLPLPPEKWLHLQRLLQGAACVHREGKRCPLLERGWTVLSPG